MGQRSRKKFLEDEGFVCDNSRQWSFRHKKDKSIAFALWEDQGDKVLDENWQFGNNGKRNGSFTISREHIRLIEEEGYQLWIFLQKAKKGSSPSRIESFSDVLTKKLLKKQGDAWYAFPIDKPVSIAEEIPEEEQAKYTEGGKKRITINAYERNNEARQKCIQYHGSKCSVCKFDFGKVYGEKYEGFIHVHHIKPISEMPENYTVDSEKDLIPVCPNCHAIIHYGNKTLNIAEVKKILKR